MISIVIPIYNEAESLAELHGEICKASSLFATDFEIIFVDDGSTDGSFQLIGKLAAEDSRIRALRFRRNFGKASALNEGFRAARGNLIFTLDGDLQDDASEIPRFIEKINEGNDVVSGWRKSRKDPWHKVFPSKVFNAMVNHLTGVKLHDHNCGMKCYRTEIFQEVRLYGELHRFVPVLAQARGFRINEIEVSHRPRKFGHSKYGASRFINGFLDLLTVQFLVGFRQRPQKLFGSVGLFFFVTGLLGLIYLTIYWILTQIHPEWHWTPLHDRPILFYFLGALFFGTQLLSIGFLAELVTAYEIREPDSCSIAERLNVPSDEGH